MTAAREVKGGGDEGGRRGRREGTVNRRASGEKEKTGQGRLEGWRKTLSYLKMQAIGANQTNINIYVTIQKSRRSGSSRSSSGSNSIGGRRSCISRECRSEKSSGHSKSGGSSSSIGRRGGRE